MNYFFAFIITVSLISGAIWAVLRMEAQEYFRREDETALAQFIIINIVLWIAVFNAWKFIVQILL